MACGALAGVNACEVTNTLVTTITTLIVKTFESTITRTEQMVTTVQGTFGQPPTWELSSPSWPVDTSTATFSSTQWCTPVSASPTSTGDVPEYTVYTASTMTTVAAAITTVTELVVVLIGAQGSVLTTSTLTVPARTSTTTLSITTSPAPVASGHPQGGGWNTWSGGAKGGLIAGCVLAFLFLVFVVLCFCTKFSGTTWYASDWSVNSHPGHIPGHQIYGNKAVASRARGGGEEELQDRGNSAKGLKLLAGRGSRGDPDYETDTPSVSRQVAGFYRPPTRG